MSATLIETMLLVALRYRPILDPVHIAMVWGCPAREISAAFERLVERGRAVVVGTRSMPGDVEAVTWNLYGRIDSVCVW